MSASFTTYPVVKLNKEAVWFSTSYCPMENAIFCGWSQGWHILQLSVTLGNTTLFLVVLSECLKDLLASFVVACGYVWYGMNVCCLVLKLSFIACFSIAQ